MRLARRTGRPTVETYHTYFEQYAAHYFPWAPPVLLRRDTCTLYGEGEIGLGATPDDFTAPTLSFRVIDHG